MLLIATELAFYSWLPLCISYSLAPKFINQMKQICTHISLLAISFADSGRGMGGLVPPHFSLPPHFRASVMSHAMNRLINTNKEAMHLHVVVQ